MAIAVPLEGGAPITVCDNCSFGFGISRLLGPDALMESGRETGVRVAAGTFPFRLIKDGR